MSDNTELLRNYDEWKNSLRNFAWLGDAVPGATDIDVFVERRGSFLVLETKAWMPNYGIKVPFGQYLALKALADLPQFTVILIGETDDEDLFYYLDIAEHTPRKYRTTPVRYGPELFQEIDQAGILENVAHWYSQASA